ncbi:unnamed protein product [Anisakis simplex]|uniref:Uncharacterized protein n=1 Tax=Anisakis simplex TaxID=6269 RepID=A0A0M3K6X9_ANISI|nr:unnamed protein product [Anisakis simplex]
MVEFGDHHPFAKVNFGSRRRPAWQRWEAVDENDTDKCGNDFGNQSDGSIACESNASTVYGVSLETDAVTLSPQQRYSSNDTASESCTITSDDDAENETELDWDGDWGEWSKSEQGSKQWAQRNNSLNLLRLNKQRRMLFTASNSLSPIPEYEETQSERCSSDDSSFENTDESNLNKTFIINNECAHSSSSSDSYYDADQSTLSKQMQTTQDNSAISDEESVNVDNETSFGDKQRKQALIVGKNDDGDHQEILFCNGPIENVIFGPCTVTEKGEQNVSSVLIQKA